MNELEILSKIEELPQTRYTLANSTTELIKLYRKIKRLEKQNIICKRYFHINGARQVVYIKKNLDCYLTNYLMQDIDNPSKEKEYLICFSTYNISDFNFFVDVCYLLDSNKWLKLEGVYLDKNNMRCFS